MVLLIDRLLMIASFFSYCNIKRRQYIKVIKLTVSLELMSISLVRRKQRERGANFPKRSFVAVQ